MIRVVQYGLGPIGLGVARLIARRHDMQIAGAIDIDPRKVGHDLGELLGDGQTLGVLVSGDAAAVLDKSRVDIVVLTTSSALAKIMGQIKQIAAAGTPVIS